MGSELGASGMGSELGAKGKFASQKKGSLVQSSGLASQVKFMFVFMRACVCARRHRKDKRSQGCSSAVKEAPTPWQSAPAFRTAARRLANRDRRTAVRRTEHRTVTVGRRWRFECRTIMAGAGAQGRASAVAWGRILCPAARPLLGRRAWIDDGITCPGRNDCKHPQSKPRF